MKKKTKNSPDLTLRNLHAMKKKHAVMEIRIEKLEEQHKKLMKYVQEYFI